jgi:hypothetical protein
MTVDAAGALGAGGGCTHAANTHTRLRKRASRMAPSLGPSRRAVKANGRTAESREKTRITRILHN